MTTTRPARGSVRGSALNGRLARLWVAAFCSETAEWMLQVALPILVYQATGSTASTAAIMIMGLVPAVLLSPVAGILADRVDRRLVLLVVAVGQALVAAPLLVGGGALWLVMAAQAGLAAFFEPARNALVPQLTDDITAANGLLAAGSNVARLVGAWLGGLLLAFGGVRTLYLVYAAVLLVAACALVPRLAPKPLPRKEEHTKVWFRLDRRLWMVGVVLTLMSVSQGMFLVLFVPFVLDTLAAGPDGVGVLRGVQAVGGLAAGFLVAVLARRLRAGSMLGWGSLCFGVLSAVVWHSPALTTAFGVYVGLFVAAGAPGVVANSGLLSILQTAVRPQETGRLMSAAFAVMALGTAAGMLVAGLAGTVVLDVQAGLYVIAGALALLHRRRRAASATPTR